MSHSKRLQTEKTVIKLRIDVDYPYPSRLKSFIYTGANVKISKDYLKNSKIIAKMINDSPKHVKAYWFFTYKTIPDEELLLMLNPLKHEVSLHVINNPIEEMSLLEKTTGRRAKYYTIHGTSRLLGRILWGRWKIAVPTIPQDFPLQSFHGFSTFVLDSFCYAKGIAKAFKTAEAKIAQGRVLEVHPAWLFQHGSINRRGSYYEVLRRILNVDKEITSLEFKKKLFFRIARNKKEYQKDIVPTEMLVEKLREIDVDVFTFIERKWNKEILNPSRSWIKTTDNVALLKLSKYEDWWTAIGKKTRNMIRKAKKSGVITKVATANEELAKGIWKIYNEQPIRQGRSFPHYGVALARVRNNVLSSKKSTFIGAFVKDELAGFIQLVHGDNITIISQILSLQKHWDKAVNNSLVAKSIEICANQQENWLMYGRMGNHPSLDKFKQNNGFAKISLVRYYLPLTAKGKLAAKLRLHREFKDVLPQSIKYKLIPLYNWANRTRKPKKGTPK